MNESKKRFVDQLLAADAPSADAPSADARQHYEKEMRTMFEKTLTRGERREHLVVTVVMGLFGLGLAIFTGLNALFGWPSRSIPEGPEWKFLQAASLLTAMALLAVAAISFRVYWRGMASRRTANDWTAGTAVGYTGVLGCLFLFMALDNPEILRDQVRVLALVLLGFAAVAWIRHCIVRAEMKTAEKLLEIELRVAELGEALQARPTPGGPASAKQPAE
jgi:hypothetical protein